MGVGHAFERAVTGDAVVEVFLGALDHRRRCMALEKVEPDLASGLRELANPIFIQPDKSQAAGGLDVAR
jgi:hypothetical protein